MDMFFDGETCANVFFHTFELFDTMHAIHYPNSLALISNFDNGVGYLW